MGVRNRTLERIIDRHGNTSVSIGMQRTVRQQAKLLKPIDGLNTTRIMIHHAAATPVCPVRHRLVIVRPNRTELGIHLHHDNDTAKQGRKAAVMNRNDLTTRAGNDLHDSPLRPDEGQGKARPIDT